MFLCQRCGLQSKPGEKKTMVVVEKREKNYAKREGRGRQKGMSVLKVDRGGHGFEVAREEAACESCVKIPVVVAVQRWAEAANAGE